MRALRGLLPSGALLAGLLALLLLQRAALTPARAVLYTGIARADNGMLALELKIEPPVAQPGDTVQLTVALFNRDPTPASPTLELLLPFPLMPEMGALPHALPGGATINLQSNGIIWRPVLAANGRQSFTIPLQVTTADLTRAEQVIQAVLEQHGLQYGTTATMWVGILPLIQEMLPQVQVAVGQPITLEAQLAGSGPFAYSWNLGDGRLVSVAAPEVVFPAAGQYEVLLEVSNPLGRTSRSAVVSVVPLPVASFTPDDLSPGVGQPVRFLSASGGRPPLQFTWDFGDGTTVAGEPQPQHVYETPGTYDVQLVVENEFGRSEAFAEVSVGVPPIADLVLPPAVVVGQPLQAEALGDSSVTTYRWDMGDGRQREGALVNHIYRYPGDYYVTLSASNTFATTQAGRWLRVDSGVSSLYLSFVAQDIAQEPSLVNNTTPGVVAAGVVAPDAVDPDAVATASVATEGLDVPMETVELAGAFVLPPVALPPGATAAEQLFIYVNEARRLFGVPPLAHSQELSAAAHYHSHDKAYYPDAPHVGTDGTTPAERFLRFGFPGGYAGEATAWGFADPREAVEFWVNSEPHRNMLLNRYVTDVGVGYAEDYATRNIWHWTAELGNRFGAPAQPVLRIHEPRSGINQLDSDIVNYAWTWPLPLASNQQFVVYLQRGDEQLRLGRINQAVYGSRFVLSASFDDPAGEIPLSPFSVLNFDWFVRLEDSRGATLAESERRSISLRPDPNALVATPVITVTIAPTATAGIPIVTATPGTPSASPTPEGSATLPPPPPDTPVVPLPIVTATPLPPTVTPSPPPSPSPVPSLSPTPAPDP